jgi:transcriptional regulator with XRE-family HTH domain
MSTRPSNRILSLKSPQWRNVAEAFGAAVRDARKQRGMSQEMLAKTADVDRTFLSQLERALTTPSVPVVYRIAEALRISARSLVARCDRHYEAITGKGEKS